MFDGSIFYRPDWSFELTFPVAMAAVLLALAVAAWVTGSREDAMLLSLATIACAAAIFVRPGVAVGPFLWVFGWAVFGVSAARSQEIVPRRWLLLPAVVFILCVLALALLQERDMVPHSADAIVAMAVFGAFFLVLVAKPAPSAVPAGKLDPRQVILGALVVILIVALVFGVADVVRLRS
jgi:hypothetical protein